MRNKNLKSSIIELRKKGKTINEISITLNCAKSTVSYHINSCNLGGNIKPRINLNQINDDDFIGLVNDEEMINNIMKWKLSGLSYNEIHKKCNLSHDKIKRICRILKINKYYSKQINEDIVHKINETYNKCKSIRKTAKNLKISRELIRQNIPTPTKLSLKEKKQTNVNAVRKHRQEMKKKLIKYLGGKCKNCGYCKNISALTFHHRNPKEKTFTVGGRNYAWDRMIKEVNKCDLLCHNCHAELHDELRQQNFKTNMF